MKNLIKKILVIAFIFISCSLILPISATTVNADDPSPTTGCPSILGFKAWYCGTKFADNNVTNEDDLKRGIWIVAANIADNITVLATYLVLGYVIYGGYLYIFSAGDSGKVATASKTLTRAFIGLAIVMCANLIVSIIKNILVKNSLSADCLQNNNCSEDLSMVKDATDWFITISGIIAFTFVVYGGISFAISTGNPNKVQKAKQILTYALIGLAVVGLSKIITSVIFSYIRDARDKATATFIQQNTKINTISKKGYYAQKKL